MKSKIYKKKNLYSKKNKKKQKNKRSKKLSKKVGGANSLFNTIKNRLLGNDENNTSKIDKIVQQNNNGSIMRDIMNNADKLTVKNILPFKKNSQTESTQTYDNLEIKDRKIRESNVEARMQDEELEEKQRIIEKLKNKDKKGKDQTMTSGFISTLTKTLGLQNQDELDTKIEEIEENKEIIKLATARKCNASFILGLKNLLNTCSKYNLIEANNIIVRLIKEKRNSFNYETRKEIDNLNVIEYNEGEETKIENMNNFNFDEIKKNKDIAKLETEISKSLNK